AVRPLARAAAKSQASSPHQKLMPGDIAGWEEPLPTATDSARGGGESGTDGDGGTCQLDVPAGGASTCPLATVRSSAPGDSCENESPDFDGAGRPEPTGDVLELRSAGEDVVDEENGGPLDVAGVSGPGQRGGMRGRGRTLLVESPVG